MKKAKKIVISLIVTLLITFIGYQGYKTVEAVSAEMRTTGTSMAGPRYITYEDLKSLFYYLCSGHGITLTGEQSGNVSSGGQEQNESTLTVNDLGKRIFEISDESTENPYSATTSRTYGYYADEELKVATPAEAYILAEASQNVGGYPSYVQEAWWATPGGGSSNSSNVNSLSIEAFAFEEYINNIKNGKTETHEITVDGKTSTVSANSLDYKISGEYSNAEVQYDEENEKYLIGPFKINYTESSVTTDRGTVEFAGITNMTLISNLGKVESSKWFLKYEGRTEEDTTKYPHNGEEFYIVLDYIADMRYIVDLQFDFRYMNAAGEYKKLTGEYFNAEWEPKSEAVWCDEGAKDCPCGGHHKNAQYDSNGNMTCSGGAKKCSHGYYGKHIAKWNYWLELTDLVPDESQPITQLYYGARWYEKVNYSLRITIKDEPTPRPEELIKLTIPMAGEVWIDDVADKKNADLVEGTRQDSEKGYKNAEVYIYKVIRDSKGNIVSRELAKIYDEDNKTELTYPIYTDKDGKYIIPNINVPGTGKVSYMKENNYDVSYDVEFKYDGQHYEASAALSAANGDANKYINATKTEKTQYEKNSIASENATVRDEFNNKFKEIYGGNSIDKKGNTEGYSTNGKDVLNLDYTSTEFSLPNDTNTRRLSTLTVLDKNEHIIEQYKMTATTGNTGVYYPVDNKISVSEADDIVELSVVKEDNKTTTTYKTIYDYMLHINLAVKEREKADLSTFKDLYKAEILVNEKEITKTYNKYVDVEDEENKEALKVQIEACKIGKYNLGLYSSDYEYRSTVYETSSEVVKNIKADTDLKVYLTYRIAINNETQAEDDIIATINQINDYYDKTFTLVNEDVKANVLDNDQNRVSKTVAESPYYRIVKSNESPEYTYWSNNMARFKCNDTNTLVNDDYKKLTITDLKEQKLSAGDQLELFITFEVDKNGYVGTSERTNLLGEKNNIAEIANYSTYYSNGKVAGIIDRDSAPDNIDLNRNTKSWYEDDTESAPAVDIKLYKYNREINGTVWEDAESVELLYGQLVANGLMDKDEKKIKGIDVQLVEKIKIDGIEYEKIWSEDDFTNLTAEEKSNYRLKDVTTDENGYYYFKGVLAGNYVVRFKYGNKESNIEYNGQDYKNTAYQANIVNEDGTATLNNEWQDLKTSALNEARVSDARDYELQRMKVVAYSREINNSIGNVLESADKEVDHKELIENTQMVANTAKLNIEIEHQDYIDYGTVNKVDGLEEYTYLVKNIDFGLEKRSGTAIELDKKISKLELYKEDGNTLLLSVSFNEDGTINKEKESNVKLSKVVHLDEQNNTQGFEYIPMESEYKNGTILKIEYQIIVKNNSEVDWTGKLANYNTSEEILARVEALEKTQPYVSGEMIEYGEYVGLNYYNNKNNEEDKIVKTKVEQIIDYIDNDASPDMDADSLVENSSWTAITLEQLQNDKILDENVYTEKDGNRLLLDSKDREYVTANRQNVLVSENNLYNPSAIAELVPEKASEATEISSSGKIRVVVSKQMSEENSESDIYNNIAEIISYSNTVGRRDEMAVPGNAEVHRGEYLAATGYDDGKLDTTYTGAKEVVIDNNTVHLNGERDTDSPSYVTLTEPTGISIREYNQKTYVVAIAVAGIILVAGIVVIKKKIIK